MTWIKKYWISAISLLLVAAACLSCAANGFFVQTDAVETKIRTVSVPEKYAEGLSVFTSYSITEDESAPSFTGTTAYSDDYASFFDNVSVSDTEAYHVQYDCTFDMDAFQYTLTATLINESGAVIEAETLVTDAFVTEAGGIDAYIEIDGQCYLMSEVCAQNGIDSCGIFTLIAAAVAVVVVIYVVVAETAEQIRSRQNYAYNQKLESGGKGVSKGNYITDQSEVSRRGYNCGNYRFGFTTFAKAGCAVASSYNAMVAFKKPEMLSETIYCFEKWAIEFAVGWGNFGSDPLEMGRYLSRKGIGYTMYLSYSSFKKAVESKSSCYILMSTWNDPITTGAHTFYVQKQSKCKYMSYNQKLRDYAESKDSIDAMNEGSGFIVGYIIWKK